MISTVSAEVSRKATTQRVPLWWIRLTHFEYWPFGLFYIPAYFYWLWLSVKNKNLLYFTAANPAIHLGGFFGESKSEILEMIPDEFKAKTIVASTTSDTISIVQEMRANSVNFPIVCKPDKGERGTKVQIIYSESELESYKSKITDPIFIIQEYVSWSTELGILYYRFPDKSRSGISSVTTKQFFTITGNGIDTLEDLIKREPRYHFQLKKLREKLSSSLQNIIPAGKTLVVEPIGNHCKGTMFLNGNKIINEQLVKVFDGITCNMEGFYFGRFDLRVSSLEDLCEGVNIKILELNGTTSEPSHIYDPSTKLTDAYRDIFHNMDLVSEIASMNMQNGVRPAGWSSFFNTTISHFFGPRTQ